MSPAACTGSSNPYDCDGIEYHIYTSKTWPEAKTVCPTGFRLAFTDTEEKFDNVNELGSGMLSFAATE